MILDQLFINVILVQQDRLVIKFVQEMMVRPELQEILVLRVRPDLKDLKDLKVSKDLLDLPVVLKVIRVRLVLRETLAQPIHLVMDNGQEMLQES